MTLPYSIAKELYKRNFPWRGEGNMDNLPSAESILAAIDGPVTMSRWKDGSGFSAFDADVNEDYPHRANGLSLSEALAKLWLLKNRPSDEEFFDLTP